MDNNKIIQNDLLKRKIFEYFSKYPKAKSVIIKTDLFGTGKISWKVIKEKKGYAITEVKTAKQKLFLEAPVGGQSPAPGTQQPPQMPQNSVQAKQANVQQFAQLDLQTKLAQLATGMMLNYDTTINTLAQIVKDKSQDLVQFRRALESGINAAPLDANQKRLVGNVLGILTSISNESTLMSSKQIKGKPLLKEEDENSKKKDNDETPETSDPQDANLETSVR